MPYQPGSSAQRIRIGLTSLAFVFLIVLIASVITRAGRDETNATQQATARYKTGLGNIAEAAEAERLLTQAEIDNSLAKLGIWRALLGVAAAQGDLAPFLSAATR